MSDEEHSGSLPAPDRIATVRTFKALFADDDDLLRELVSTLLRDSGFDVVEAQSGQQALSLLASTNPDILMTDISMPGPFNGWALAKECRSLVPELPVIYMTTLAQSSSEMVENSIFIQKPYSPHQILAAVRQLTSSGLS